ncbi:SprT family zinc-dependent metalloprotease [Bifidobacterium sp.]|uniref:YgjP family zinc-dependent metalloprotease n=3 Tax=Bifidobacterium sp. TaxID=41200 RepID=UPI0025C109D0|nr:SprT family zinc-dependent metalloprotease [Bifidobacterium sp.]MCI1225347.1 M48 family metallopeptidase [Bifidobacterium sp.]
MPYRHRTKPRVLSEKILAVDGLSIHVARKTIRNLYLRVRPSDESIEVSAPARMSDARIVDFVRERREWIEHQERRLAAAKRSSIAQIGMAVDGASGDGLGSGIGTVPGGDGDSGDTNDGGGNNDNGSGNADDGAFVWTDECKRRAAHAINSRMPGLLAQWEPVIGRSPSHITLRVMSSRWGSCTPRTGRIRINLQLGLMDERFLNYVLVHEMTHLWAGGHGPEFQRHMDRYLPDWRQLRRELNRQLVL